MHSLANMLHLQIDKLTSRGGDIIKQNKTNHKKKLTTLIKTIYKVA